MAPFLSLLLLQIIETELSQYNQEFEEAAGTVSEIAGAGVEPEVETELRDLLAQARDLLTRLSDKLAERRKRLQAVITQSGEFEKDLDEFLLWLTKTERAVVKSKPPSAHVDVVKRQKDEFQVPRH